MTTGNSNSRFATTEQFEILIHGNPTLATVAIMVAATGLRLLLEGFLGHCYPFVTLSPAAVLVALAFGWRHGLLATVLAGAGSFAVGLDGDLPEHHREATAIFTVVMVVTVLLGEFVGHLRRKRRTERTNQLIRQSESRLRKALSASGDEMWDYDLASQSRLRYGWQNIDRDIQSMEVVEDCQDRYERIHPEDRERVRSAFAEHCNGATPAFRAEYRLRGGDGRYRWIYDRGEAIERDEAGRTTRIVGLETDITTLKLIEEERQHFASLAESSPEFIGMCDLNFSPFYINRAGMALVGLADLETALECKVQDFFFPEDLPYINSVFFPKVLAEGHGEVEIRFRNFKTGEPVWMLYNVFNIHDAAGAVVGWATVSRNIHQRKLTEQALAETGARLVAVISSAMDAIVSTSADLGIRYFNPAAESTFGCSAAEARKLSLPQCFVPGYEDRLMSLLEELASSSRENLPLTAKGELHALRTDGSAFPIEGSVSRLVIGDEVSFTFILRDVSQRRAAEDALKKMHGDLSHAQTIAKIGSWRMDVRYNTLTWSAESYRIFGVPQGTPLTYESFLAAVHPDDRDYVDRSWSAALRGEPYDIEHRLVPGSEVAWVRERAELEFDSEGQLLGGFGTTQDITEKKRAEAALIEADRRKDEFLAMLAHELRNPLVPIASAARMLQSETIDKAGLHWISDTLDRNTQHMVRLVDDLLDVSRISRGKIMLLLEPIELGEVLRQAVDYTRPLFASKHQQVNMHLSSDPIRIVGDRVRLIQVFSNVLNNAAKYTPDAGRIDITAEQCDDRTAVRIRDNGSGIAADLLPKVFELFLQDERMLDRSLGGLGIGLTLVRELVQLHGGRVNIESGGQGQGTTVTVTLPVNQPQVDLGQDQASRPVHTVGEVAGLAPDTILAQVAEYPVSAGITVRKPMVSREELPAEPPRVLIVEDNPDVAECMVTLLRMHGYRVEAAADGPAGLAVVPSFQPHVVILDIGLPGMDGYQVARRLRELPGGTAMTLVALTGYGLSSHREQGIQAGFDHYLVKPASIDRICGLIDSASSLIHRDSESLPELGRV